MPLSIIICIVDLIRNDQTPSAGAISGSSNINIVSLHLFFITLIMSMMYMLQLYSDHPSLELTLTKTPHHYNHRYHHLNTNDFSSPDINAGREKTNISVISSNQLL